MKSVTADKLNTCWMRAAAVLISVAPLLAGLHVVPVRAETAVSFHAIGVPLSAFKIRRMKAEGIADPQPTPGAQLSGELNVPPGEGPFPAVVLVHDCRGMQAHQQALAAKLVSWGYVTLRVDSYGPRGVEPGSVCANIKNWDTKDFVGGRTLDVYGALQFLSTHAKVDAQRLAVIGWDRDTTLSSVSKSGMGVTYPHLKPRVAISFYPDCRRLSSGEFASPILVFAAERDDWWPAQNCLKMQAAAQATDGSKVDLVIYDNAQHGFDDPAVGAELVIPDAFNPNKSPAIGATLAYDAESASAAELRIKAFLATLK